MNEKHPYLDTLLLNLRTSRTKDAKSLRKEKWVTNKAPGNRLASMA